MISEDVEQHLKANVEGEQIEFDEENLTQVVDIAKVRKAYKLGAPPKNKYSAESKQDLKEMELIILGMMALRGAT